MQTIVWGYDITVNGQTDITKGPGAIQVFSFIMVYLVLCGIVKYQHLVDCLYSIRDAPFLP